MTDCHHFLKLTINLKFNLSENSFTRVFGISYEIAGSGANTKYVSCNVNIFHGVLCVQTTGCVGECRDLSSRAGCLITGTNISWECGDGTHGSTSRRERHLNYHVVDALTPTISPFNNGIDDIAVYFDADKAATYTSLSGGRTIFYAHR